MLRVHQYKAIHFNIALKIYFGLRMSMDYWCRHQVYEATVLLD